MDFNIIFMNIPGSQKQSTGTCQGEKFPKKNGKLGEKLQERYFKTNLAELLEKSSEGLLSLEGQEDR